MSDPFDVYERVRSLDFVTRSEDSGPRSFETSRAHVHSSIEIMQEILSILQRGESLRRHQSTSPYELHASTLNAMICTTLNSSGPRLVEQENPATPSLFTPTWIHAIMAAQDGPLERTKDGKYSCRIKDQRIEMSESESQPVLQFIHETLPREQDVEKEIETQSAILADLTQYVQVFVEALKHANILKSTLVENRNVLLSYLQRDTEMSESGNLELPHQLGEIPADSILEYHSSDAGHDTADEPTSTGFETASYQAHETSSSMLRTSSHSKIGTSPDVHSTGGASKKSTSSANRQSKMIERKVAPNFRNSTGAMSSQPFNTELVHSNRRVNFSRRASSFVAGESPRRSRSPTPVSTKEKVIPPTAHEKAHRVSFTDALIQEHVPWSQIPSLYREEFGIWRSADAIRSAYRIGSVSNEVGRRSRRTKSPTPVSTKEKNLPPTAHEKSHRIPFLEALIQEGVPWSQFPSLYREEFGIWRSQGAIRTAYNTYKNRSKGFSVSKASPAQSASNEVARRSGRTKSPTPVSTAKNNILPSAHEKAHRIPFLEALIQEGVPWSQFPSLYREEFGIWRSQGAIRTAYNTHKNRSKGSTSNEVGRRESEPSSPGSDGSSSENAWSDIEFGDGEEGPSAQNPADRGSKKRNRSSTQGPVGYREVPATEQEMLHRIPFLKSERAQGLTWPEIALLYQDEFGISRPAKALSRCYHQDRHLSEMGISDQELASAQMSESESEEEPLARKRLMMSSQLNYSHSNRRGSKEDSVSKASFPRRSSVSIESSSESSSSSESTPPPVTGPGRIDLTSPETSPANPLNPASAAPAQAAEPTLVKSHADDLESSPAQGGSSSNGRI